MKEHPFFASIDWNLLALKQVTPPFKPNVESDESVANFDPEFTSADMGDIGLENMDLDDSDPSPDWVALSQSVTNSTIHTPNGPLGSDRPGPAPVQGIEIAKSKKKRDADVPPLTNSVQENFRGFTYDGLESQRASLRAAGEPTELFQNEEDEDLADDEVPADDDALADKGFDDFEGERGREGDVSDDEVLEWELDP